MISCRTVPFLLVCLLLSFGVLAQHTYTFSFETADPIAGRSNFNRLRVIDKRADTQSLGYVKTGAFNRKATIITEKPLEEVLAEHFAEMLRASRNGIARDNELLLVLYDITIEDVSADAATGTLFIDADFYGGAKGGYRYLGTADTFSQISGGLQITKDLLNAAQANLTHLLWHYAFLAKAATAQRIYTEPQLLSRRTEEKLVHKIYRNAPDFKKGVYYNVKQFLNNQPVDTPFVIKEFKTSRGLANLSVYYPKAKGRKATPLERDGFFAAYDGENWACGFGDVYVKMNYIDGDFYTVRYFEGAKKGIDGKVVTGVLFGVAGVLVATAAAGSNTTVAGVFVANGVTGSNTTSAEYGRYYCRFDPVEKKYIPIKLAR